MGLPLSKMGKNAKKQVSGGRGMGWSEQEFRFDHVRFETSIIHPCEDVKSIVEYETLEFLGEIRARYLYTW